MAELRQEMLKRQGGDYANIAEPVLELKSRSKWRFHSTHSWTVTSIRIQWQKSVITTLTASSFYARQHTCIIHVCY